mgnify:CR=1 FL=1
MEVKSNQEVKSDQVELSITSEEFEPKKNQKPLSLKPIITNPINGTRDFFPDDMEKREYLFKVWENVAKSYNFKRYDSPILERTELYIMKSGDEITKSMYHFETDGQKVCLRPELTPSFVRMVSTERINSSKKWFNIGQCWRFDTVTEYRKREHYQLNCDIVSVPEELPFKAELEILSVVVNIFKELGLSSEQIKVHISHRKIINYFLQLFYLSENSILNVIQLLDKIGKIDTDEFSRAALLIPGMTLSKIDTLIKFTKIKNLSELHVTLMSIPNSNKQLYELSAIFNWSKHYEIDSWLVLDLSIVRGLDYYTGLVFECFSTFPHFNRAICGGGRYDNITSSYGIKKLCSFVGFGMGDVVLLKLLDLLNYYPKKITSVDYCVLCLIPEVGSGYFDRYPESIQLATTLRKFGSVELVDKMFSSEKAALKFVDNIQPGKVIIFGRPVESVSLTPNDNSESERIYPITVRDMTMDKNDPNRIQVTDAKKFVRTIIDQINNIFK